MKKILIMACAAGMLTLLPACGGQKTSDAASKQDTVQTATNSNAPYADPSQENSYNAKLGGKDFVITIKRAADKSLPTVTDDLGKSFYDNRVDVTITCNGQPFFSKSYTKEAFASFLTTKSETQGTILLGMAYDSAKRDGHAIRLGAQVGQVGIEEGPAFCVEIPLDGSASSIVRDTNQDTTGDDGVE